jgi:hypothetical protein
MKILPIILGMTLTTTILAAEADHYTMRNIPLEDISTQVNQRANKYLALGVAKANKLGRCNNSLESEQQLYPVLREYFGNHSKGQLVKDILYTNEFTKRKIVLNQSIYKDWSIWNGFLLGRKSAANSPLALSPMIQMDEQLIGVDKLEHMFGMGFSYFKRHFLKGISLKRVLKRGIALEKTILGGNMLATGVFSYGDLSANFNGMRFWNHILQKRDDILGLNEGYGPYVKCVKGSWKVVRENPIDLTKYIDASMDESINCNKFATKSGTRKYTKVVKNLSTDEQEFRCPMNQNRLQSILEKYSQPIMTDYKLRPISHWIINTDGNDDVSYLNEF